MYFWAPIPPVPEGETKEKRLLNKERDPNYHYVALAVQLHLRGRTKEAEGRRELTQHGGV
jgi:hypothetical protein